MTFQKNMPDRRVLQCWRPMGLVRLVARGIFTIMLLGGCAHTEEGKPRAWTHCHYDMERNPGLLLTMSGKNEKGDTCFVANAAAFGGVVASPRVEPQTQVTCWNDLGEQQPLVLADLYRDGYRINSIERGHATVNGAKIPLPMWRYELIEEARGGQ